MARPKVEINPIRGLRLKQICEEQKITQKQLSNIIHITQQSISSMVNGTATVTVETADLVTRAFPEYRKEWLLGLDDYKTEADLQRARAEQFTQAIDEMEYEGSLLYTGLCAFARLNGIEITPPQTKGTGSLENYFRAVKKGYTISKGEQAVSLSVEEMNRFENEVCDFVELKLKHLFKQKGVDL